jgi:hypothetical protein
MALVTAGLARVGKDLVISTNGTAISAYWLQCGQHEPCM